VSFPAFMLLLHGGALAMGSLWLLKRHNNWQWRKLAREILAHRSLSAP